MGRTAVPATTRSLGSQVKLLGLRYLVTYDVAGGMQGALAAVPFLPNGKGALILILGGLAMLAFSLFIARLSSGPVPPSTFGLVAQRRSNVAPVVFRAITGPKTDEQNVGTATEISPPGAEWVAGLEASVERLRLGRGRILRTDSDRCLFFLADCKTCRNRRAGEHGCDRERKLIEGAVRRVASRARVTEMSCDSSGQGACTFEIFRRGSD